MEPGDQRRAHLLLKLSALLRAFRSPGPEHGECGEEVGWLRETGVLGEGNESAGPEEVSRVRAGPRTFSLTLFSLPQMWKRWLALALVAVALVHGEVGD